MYATWPLFAIYELGIMVILIDAYNVLKQKIGADYINAEQQKQFVELLTEYARAKNHELIVVFDGGDYYWPYEHKKKKVTITFSGSRSTADDVIMQYLTSLDFQNAVLVTSDRELRAYASTVRVPSIASEDFNRLLLSKDDSLMRISQNTQPLIKQSRDTNKELDNLMEKASRIIMHKNEDKQGAQGDKQNNGYTPSKKEKRLTKVIKKL
jgi:predicted RNA-binding protein with PIN domain